MLGPTRARDRADASRTRSSSTGSRWSSPRRSRGRRSPTTTARRAATPSPSIPSAPGRSGSPSTTSGSRIVLERNPNWYGVAPSRVARAGRRLPGRGRARRRGERPPRPALRRPAAAVPRPRRVPPRQGGHPGVHEVPAGLLRRLGHHRGELRPRRARGAAVARDGSSSTCSSTEGGAAVDLLPRLQHDRSGRRRARRRARAQAAPGDEPRHRQPGVHATSS